MLSELSCGSAKSLHADAQERGRAPWREMRDRCRFPVISLHVGRHVYVRWRRAAARGRGIELTSLIPNRRGMARLALHIDPLAWPVISILIVLHEHIVPRVHDLWAAVATFDRAQSLVVERVVKWHGRPPLVPGRKS